MSSARTTLLLACCLGLLTADAPAKGKRKAGWTRKRIAAIQKECVKLFEPMLKDTATKKEIKASWTAKSIRITCRCLVDKTTRTWPHSSVVRSFQLKLQRILERPDHKDCMPKGGTAALLNERLGPGRKSVDRSGLTSIQVLTDAKADLDNQDSQNLAAKVSSEDNLKRIYGCIQSWKGTGKPHVFTLHLDIDSKGRAGTVQIDPKRYEAGEFYDCVKEALSRIDFGPSTATSRKLTIPFDFSG
jgi:hypothetical protein